MLVGYDTASFIRLNACRFQIQFVCSRPSSCCSQYSVCHKYLLSVLACNKNLRLACFLFHGFNLNACDNLNTLFCQLLSHRIRHLLIFSCQETVAVLKDRHLRTKLSVYGRKFNSNISAADDYQMLWKFFQL